MKTIIKKAIRHLGYELIAARTRRKTSAEIQLNLLPDAAVIFDVGAYVGGTAKEYRSLFPRAAIYAFEPFPESFDALKRSLPGDTRFHPHNLAISDAEGVSTFHVNKGAATNSLLPAGSDSANFWGEVVETVETVTVRTSTLDAFTKTHQIDRIDILKLDVQGAELRALKGARSLLSKGAIGLIYAEVLVVPTYDGQQAFDEMLRFLREFGFQLYDIQNLAHVGGRLGQFDALFVRRL